MYDEKGYKPLDPFISHGKYLPPSGHSCHDDRSPSCKTKSLLWVAQLYDIRPQNATKTLLTRNVHSEQYNMTRREIYKTHGSSA